MAIKSSRLIGLVLHAVTFLQGTSQPQRSLCDISVELSPFAVKSMFWLRSGPITLREITYPDLVVARTDGHICYNLTKVKPKNRKSRYIHTGNKGSDLRETFEYM